MFDDVNLLTKSIATYGEIQRVLLLKIYLAHDISEMKFRIKDFYSKY